MRGEQVLLAEPEAPAKRELILPEGYRDPLALTEREAAIVASWKVADLETQFALEYDPDSGLVLPADMSADSEPTPTQKTDEPPEQKSTGFIASMANRAGEFVQKHPRLAKVTSAVGIVAAGSAVAPGTAKAFDWAHVGGAPLKPGGVHSAKQAGNFLRSPKGKDAMKAEHFSSQEIQAVREAIKTKGMHGCLIKGGEIMVSADDSVAYNVVLTDPRYPNGVPGFCITAIRHFTRNGRLFTEVINEKVAGPCTNVLLGGKHETSKPIHHKPHPRLAPVFGGKVAKDGANGNVITPFPTGIFQEDITCRSGRRTIHSPFVTMMHPTEFLARCNIGSIATVTEGTPLVNPQDWINESGTSQTIKVQRRGNLNVVTFVDRQIVIPPPPSPPGRSPTESITETKLTTAEPLFTNSPEQLCVQAEQTNTDSGGNQSTSVPIVIARVVSGEGSVSGIYGDQDGNPEHVCATFNSGPDVGQSEIDFTASSNDGNPNVPPVIQRFIVATQQDTGF